MTEPLSTALEHVAQPPQAKTIFDLIERQKPELEKALSGLIGVERFTRTIWTEIRRTPKLLECTPASLIGAMLLAAQLGLEPGPLGHVYLVPRKIKGTPEVVFIIGYKGMVHLAYGSSLVRSIRAATVYEGDRFEYEERETKPHLRHSDARPSERGEAVCYYAHAVLATGAPLIRRIWPEDVEKARSHSPAPQSVAWVEHYDAMARKTAIRRLAPTLPQSPSFGRAIAHDELPAPVFEEGSDELREPEEAA